MSGFGSVAFGAPPPANYNPNKDIEVPSPPADGVSCLAWSPVANHLLATAWDGSALCWEVSAGGQATPKTATRAESPLLCAAWHGDGASAFLGDARGGVAQWDVATGTRRSLGSHAGAVRHAAWVPSMGVLVTGSWDRSLKYWDPRSATPAHTQQLPERVYAMDAKHPLLVVGMADRHIHVYNLAAPQTPYKTLQSPLKFQTRCVSAFPDTSGYLVGSVEGRVAVHHVEPGLAAKNFTFRCHRDGADVYAVNAASFHPTHGTFVTAGSDGAYNFWDKDSKQRLKALAKAATSIPCATFNADGGILAYAVSYDWSRGASQHDPATARNLVLLHATQEAEVKSRSRPPTRR